MVVQIIGIVVILVTIVIALVYIWLMWFKETAIGKTTVGKIVTGTLESAHLASNLGYIELLSKVDEIKASPEATKACEVIADTLWNGAISAWKNTQSIGQPGPTGATGPTTVKLTTTDGQVVEVPVK